MLAQEMDLGGGEAELGVGDGGGEGVCHRCAWGVVCMVDVVKTGEVRGWGGRVCMERREER